MPFYTDVMVDIETTGTTPDRSGILQIAAVKFNAQTGEVSSNFFDQCLTLPPHRFWEQDTANWWHDQKESTLRNIMRRQRPYRDVVKEFRDWVVSIDSHDRPRFWSRGSFDYMFIASYFKDEGFVNPFPFWMATDLRSFHLGQFWPDEAHKPDIPFVGEKHNGLDDTLHQLKELFHLIDLKKRPVVELIEPTHVDTPINTIREFIDAQVTE